MIEYRIGDVFDRVAEIPDGTIDLVVTSPPFLALRSYLPADHPDKAKEIGSEATPAAFLDTMLVLTAEWRRVLAPHGSICVELGDTYSGSGGAGGDYDVAGLRDGQERWSGSGRRRSQDRTNHIGGNGWPRDKSLCLIPHLYSASLAYGRSLLNPDHTIEPWRVRNVVAWVRPNPPVGALGDKCRPATSYVTVACVGRRRWFDMDAERTQPKSGEAGTQRADNRRKSGYRGSQSNGAENKPRSQAYREQPHLVSDPAGAPLLDWWEIPTQPYAGSHYATFPIELPRRLISLMCPMRVCTACGRPSERIVGEVEYLPSANYRGGKLTADTTRVAEGVNQFASNASVRRVAPTLGWSDCGHDAWRPGVVLDPFSGSGTTLAAALGLGRDAIGIDIDARNADLARERVGMFLEVAS